MPKRLKLTDTPEYTAAVEKATDISQQLDAAKRDAAAAAERAAQLRNEAASSGLTRTQLAARDLLDGKAETVDDAIRAASETAAEKTRRIHILEEAHTLAGQQVNAARNAGSKAVCDSCRGEYMAMLREAIKAANALGSIATKIRDFREDLWQEGVHADAFMGQAPDDNAFIVRAGLENSISRFIAQASEAIELNSGKGGE